MVDFLCGLVKLPTEQDKKKLKIMLQFLNQTIDASSVFCADSLRDMVTFIDAPYTVQPYMKSHTGSAMSILWGLIHCISSKHKLDDLVLKTGTQ